MSKRAKKGKSGKKGGKGKKGRAGSGALARALAIAGSIAGVLALGAGGLAARGALLKASRDLGRSLEGGLWRLKRAWPRIDFTSGVPTARGLA